MYYNKNRVNFIINLYQIVNLMKKKKNRNFTRYMDNWRERFLRGGVKI